ncbi:N-acetylmuramoyl-L-alanine amidase family protein [Shouchella shacheensis]|uniref:N-acetylmuramoyl-L-alanine amidase family protein n=1 Tax=Shouchella shacheensis TaxID=1649580 RepID=UPI00074039F5|nr:N-acetylmuramoyl-L-alanine amidase [Shouchella shacheensis]
MVKRIYVQYCMLALLAIAFHTLFVSDSEVSASVRDQTIVIDAGHGGSDFGAVANGLYEKELVYDVAHRTRGLLESSGANVVMTRTGDYFVALEERSRIANANNADSFVSIHANAAAQISANGTETYHFPTSAAGRSLATSLQQNMVATFNSRDRGVKAANFSVLRNTEMQAALVELGFVTNQAEAEVMKTNAFRNQAASAIFNGLNENH